MVPLDNVLAMQAGLPKFNSHTKENPLCKTVLDPQHTHCVRAYTQMNIISKNITRNQNKTNVSHAPSLKLDPSSGNLNATQSTPAA